MKKLLLTLSLVLGFITLAQATDVNLPATDKTWTSYTWTGDETTQFAATVEDFDFIYGKGAYNSGNLYKPKSELRVYGKASLEITAQQGISFNKIVFKSSSNKTKATTLSVDGWTTATSGSGESFVVTLTSTTPKSSIKISPSATFWIGSVVITTDEGGDPQPQVVETPVFSVAAGAVEKGTEVSISCATQGATIRYTTNGDDVTETSDVYSTAIEIKKAMTIKAKAFKDGMTASEQAVADYTLSQVDPEQPGTSGTATFNFADPTTLNPPYTEDDATIVDQDNKYANVGGVTFSANGVTIVNNTESGTEARMYLSTAAAASGWAYRVYKTSTTTIAVPANCKLTSIEFETQSSSHGTALGKATFSAGSYDKTSKTLTFDASANVNEVTITPLATIGFTKITVKYAAVAPTPDAPVLELPAGATEPMPLDNYTNAETNNYFVVKVSWPEGLTLHYKTNCRGTQLDGVTLPYSEKQKALDFAAGNNADKTLTDPLTGDLTGTAAGTNKATFGFASQGTFECYVVDAAGNQSDTKKLQFTGTSTGVEDIVADGENSEAVFYNMQGVRVANPAAGNVYIKVQAGKASKVLVK